MEIKTSAQTAKERLLNLKGSDLPKTYVGDEPPKGFGPGDAEVHEQLKPIEPPVALTVAETLAQRGSRYGDFTDHAALCQQFKDTATGFIPANYTTSTPWAELDPVKKQALEVIFDKIARILTGDPNYDDNWHDIQGYAKLVEDRLPCNVAKRQQEDFDKLSPRMKEACRSAEAAAFYGDTKKSEV